MLRLFNGAGFLGCLRSYFKVAVNKGEGRIHGWGGMGLILQNIRHLYFSGELLHLQWSRKFIVHFDL